MEGGVNVKSCRPPGLADEPAATRSSKRGHSPYPLLLYMMIWRDRSNDRDRNIRSWQDLSPCCLVGTAAATRSAEHRGQACRQVRPQRPTTLNADGAPAGANSSVRGLRALVHSLVPLTRESVLSVQATLGRDLVSHGSSRI